MITMRMNIRVMVTILFTIHFSLFTASAQSIKSGQKFWNGMVLYTACAMGKQPACMLFSKPIDSLAASGAILGDVWTEASMPVVDTLGDEFLETVKTGCMLTVGEDGLVTVED